MGYHETEIPRGKVGEFSKIEEEFLESKDALGQDNHIMLLLELSDMIGAIELFIKKYNMSLDDLIKMKDATHRAFQDGPRTNRDGY